MRGKGLSSGFVRGWVLLLFFWYFTARAFRCLPNCDPPFLVRSLWLYILLLPSSWPSICWSCRSLLEYLSHLALLSTCCELQQTGWHYLGVIPSLMRPDCQLRAFNAEVTDSFIIALSPCSHSCPPTLVPSFGTTGRAALDGVLPFPPNNFGSSLVILRRFPPRPGPLGLIFEMGRGTQILWPHNNPSKFCCPDPWTGRKVLMSSGYLTSLSSLVIC